MKKCDSLKLTARGVLLDIEGTTSSISFVHEVMFPFVRAQLDEFLAANFARPDVAEVCEQIARDAGHATLTEWSGGPGEIAQRQLIGVEVHRLMDGDVKATGLKALQGLIWANGFRDGCLRSHVYPDVIPQIKRWRQGGLDVRIYSSGSIAAQKLFFGHVDGVGDCLDLFSGHYDTTMGSKREAGSYERVASEWGLLPAEIVFVSDIAGELAAAAAAGMQVVASVRPGNAPLDPGSPHAEAESFEQIRVEKP
jgi:enolase-phosphatase E1